MEKIKFQIHSLGCKINQYDGAVIKRELENYGFIISSTSPDVVIINTCTVTKTAITKDRKMINRYRKLFPNSKVVVMGCWPQIDQGVIDEFEDSVIVWGVGKPKALIKKIVSLFPIGHSLSNKVLESGILAPLDRSRYFIKVGDGCDQFCSYCIIPFARGRLRGRSNKEIIKEIKEAIRRGYREIVLSGIHLGKYKYRNTNLITIIKKIIAINNLARIRLSSIEINEVTPELIKLIASSDKICSHLHISLQSGTDKILKAMNRPYGVKYFKEKVAKIRREIPNIAITTDIIVGFPGETKSEFIDTYKFAKEMEFSKIHVFSFSAHEKTLAYQLTDKVSKQEIKERSKELRRLSDILEEKYRKKILKIYKNKPLSLVVENSKDNKFRCKTEFYFDLYLNKKDLQKNILV